ncbi:MAG: 7,8-dihydroneopterin aldolase/epimerase/oxygenase [Actinomycetota bacterium]|nr:7,8-dihydroneopterin aldolase/epimerase/oxygenase [Actinomycetota bacterium]
MDKISIHDLRVEMRIGVTEEERATPRPILISVDMWVDLISPGDSDKLAETVDYHAVTIEIAKLLRTTEARLLEHVAEKIAALVGAFQGVNGVSVEVTKESPPLAEDVRAVSVKIERPSR